MTNKSHCHLQKKGEKERRRTGLRTALRRERASVVESALETIEQVDDKLLSALQLRRPTPVCAEDIETAP